MRSFCIAATVLLLDQASKWAVMNAMALGESVPVLGSFFRLTYIQNPGAVFGLRLGGQAIHLLFAVVALVLVVAMLWRMPQGERLASLGLALVLGGALGNIVDRLRFGVVIDFLDFGFGDWRWWVFNVADACVTTGAGLLMVAYSFQKPDEDAVHGSEDPARP